MKKVSNAAEVCDYIADMSLELSRMAEEAGAGRLADLLMLVVNQAEGHSRNGKRSGEAAAFHLGGCCPMCDCPP